MSSCLSPLPASVVVLVLLATPPTHAFERQWHAGIDGGVGGLFSDPTANGYGGGGHLTYGLSDAFNALLEVDVTRHPSAGTAGATVWSAGTGVAYTLDVARAFPYAGLLVAGYRLNGALRCAPRESGKPYCAPASNAVGVQYVLGLDYQLERNWAIGLELRLHTIFAPDPVGVLAYGTTFLHVEYLWEW